MHIAPATALAMTIVALEAGAMTSSKLAAHAGEPEGVWSCVAYVAPQGGMPGYETRFALRVTGDHGFVAEGRSRTLGAASEMLPFRASGRWLDAAGSLILDGTSLADGELAPFQITADLEGVDATPAPAPSPDFAQRARCAR